MRATERQRHHAEETRLAQRGPWVEMKTSEQEAWLPLQHYSLGLDHISVRQKNPEQGLLCPRVEGRVTPPGSPELCSLFSRWPASVQAHSNEMPHCLGGAADV